MGLQVQQQDSEAAPEGLRMERGLKPGLQEFNSSCTAADALTILERVTDYLRREIHLTLRAHSVTPTQYNVLQVLRPAPKGLTCSEVGSRLAGADPDITRLLDRLARQGLVRRRRDAHDRRAVLTEISEEGMRLLDSVTPLLEARIETLFGHMPSTRLQLLIDLLNEAFPAAKQNDVLVATPTTMPAAKAG